MSAENVVEVADGRGGATTLAVVQPLDERSRIVVDVRDAGPVTDALDLLWSLLDANDDDETLAYLGASAESRAVALALVRAMMPDA